MIINTGSRTDIPAYYSEWFYNRIKEGYVLTRNPYYPEQITKYRLSSNVVDAIVFCTKNPEPMLDRLNEISAFNQLWFVTITPYEKEIEPDVPKVEQVINSFQRVSDIVGRHCCGWRYDPIFISDKYTVGFHISQFEKMAKALSGYTNQCVVSFIDLYEKTKRNFPQVKEVKKSEQEFLIKEFVNIGNKYHIKIRTCCENPELEKLGADVSGCMTQQVLENAIGYRMKVPNRSPARVECNCMLGNDIGMYNTCGHGCLYCYANYDKKVVEQNMKQHNPKSPLLIGEVQEGDMIKEAKQVLYRDAQMNIFDL